MTVPPLHHHHEGEDELLYPFLIERPWKKYASTLRNGTRPTREPGNNRRGSWRSP
jgi:hypothetical protein